MSPTTFDTRGSGDAPPIWLVSVIEAGRSGPTAMLGIEPQTDELYGHIRDRMRRGGFRKVTHREWNTATWGLSLTAAVDVVRGDLVRVTTGATSIYTASRCPVTDTWMNAARTRRVLVALLPAGTLGDDLTDDEKQGRVADLVGRRELLGTMAPARFNMPVHRPS